jgi:hypothetical protein
MLLARRDTQDKDSLTPESNVYSRSDAAAAMDPAAFVFSETRSERELASAAKEYGEDVSLSENMMLSTL